MILAIIALVGMLGISSAFGKITGSDGLLAFFNNIGPLGPYITVGVFMLMLWIVSRTISKNRRK